MAYYEFCNLPIGEYSITVDKDSIPSGYTITEKNRGSDDTKDSDVYPDTGKSSTCNY